MNKLNLRKFFNPDRIVGSSAFIISLGTFLVLVYQTYLSNKQAQLYYEQAALYRQEQYASVLPYLELWNQTDKGAYSLTLVNNGLGPAFVTGIRVHYQGKMYEGDPAQFVYKVVVPEDSTLKFGYTNITIGRLIPAGQNLKLINVSNSENSAEKLRVLFNKQAQVEVIYKSVYEETWQLKGIANPPQKVK